MTELTLELLREELAPLRDAIEKMERNVLLLQSSNSELRDKVHLLGIILRHTDETAGAILQKVAKP